MLYKDNFFNVTGIPQVDLIITEPPHKVKSYRGDNIGDMARFKQDIFTSPNDEIDIDMLQACKLMYSLLKDGGTLIIFWDVWEFGKLRDILEQSQFTGFRWLVWKKNNPVPLNCNINYLSSSMEAFILCSKNSKSTFNQSYHNGLFEFNKVAKGSKKHMLEKPVPLLEALIEHNSNEGDIVLDPFMGSGSTGEAAVKVRREFIGVEIDDNYFKIAQERLGSVSKALI